MHVSGTKNAALVIKEISCMGIRRTVIDTSFNNVAKELYVYISPHLVNWAPEKPYYVDAEIYLYLAENHDDLLDNLNKQGRFEPNAESLPDAKKMSDMLKFTNV